MLWVAVFIVIADIGITYRYGLAVVALTILSFWIIGDTHQHYILS